MSSGPCGACKYLRRKCVKGCIFAPYFDTEQGMSHFAAVHKVFGASNASKLLLSIPANKRLETVITLCYEALARVRDPVYGCVAHIFTLQQQVLTLQAELAYVQARLSTLQSASSEVAATYSNISSVSMDPLFDTTGFHHVLDEELENCDIHSVAVDFVSRR
ncbi:LOB domain-containing protein 19-like [Nicotiana tabacum]|uniref:LOB domain-containing protein 19-like n=2 Tax=Nicotiana TaxID=4085 RepID=A0A1S3XP11_TOBAC|nr:PREDICTED: LOB domain-containing protein 19 [Nicotiana sylvestris]XP_016441663.1 PREDICTED: LOB domain-containing protein 19-like [Nicotiana tabacum]BCT36617.1 LOB domain-containing protein 19-like protein [Nicotiana tabacum]